MVDSVAEEGVDVSEEAVDIANAQERCTYLRVYVLIISTKSRPFKVAFVL